MKNKLRWALGVIVFAALVFAMCGTDAWGEGAAQSGTDAWGEGAAQSGTNAWGEGAAQSGTDAWGTWSNGRDGGAVTTIPFPAAPGSMAPNMASSPDGRVVASWIERREAESALMISVYDAGATGQGTASDAGVWGPAMEVASGESWFVNWADIPSVQSLGGDVLMAHWLDRLGDGRYAYGVRYAMSTDGGASWSEPEWLHEDQSPTEHGFVTIVPGGGDGVNGRAGANGKAGATGAAETGGGAVAIWLDGQGYAANSDDPAMSLRARAINPDGTKGPEMAIDTKTCDCCPTTAATLSDGSIIAAYRDRSDDEIRDISVVLFDGNSWSEPTRVHEDDWRINACPVNGPAVTAMGRQVSLAWFTMAEGISMVKLAFSGDGGRSFNEPVRLDLGNPAGRVQAAFLPGGDALVAWLEIGAASQEGGLYMRRVQSDGAMSDPVQVAASGSSRSNGYPALATAGSEILVLWTQPGEESQVLAARLAETDLHP